jgi:hypothetical protein
MFCMRSLILGAGAVLGLALLGGQAAAAAPGPACAPTILNRSALQDGAVTVSPLPGSRDASTQTQISFLGVPAADLAAISVVGSRSGVHRGRLQAYSQGDGASFLPSRPFVEGERVTVRGQLRMGGSVRPLLDQFTIAHEDRISSTPQPSHRGRAEVQSFHSRPELKPPAVTVTAQSSAVAPGDLFLAPYLGPGQAGPMILEPSGDLVWFDPLAPNTSAADLEVQEYEGKPALTWWQGDVTVHGFGMGEGVIANSSYTDIAHVHAGNGLHVDLHEFQLTPQGTALITAYHPILCNLSSVGGLAHGGVTDSVAQEIDVRTGLVMYEWTSIDHVALDESYEPSLPLTTTVASPYDYFHLNSINLDYDGSLLISSRNTWTVYKVNAQSGQIVWRLGGKHSSFKMGAGTGTAWQHDARELPNGSISIFDNGASPTTHSQSRAIVISLNPATNTATLVGRLTHTPPLVVESQGSMQALANGDWFVGWGQQPYVSEFGPEGQLLFDAHLPSQYESYRDFRFVWTGTPSYPPVFAFQSTSTGATAYASWNGATLVTSWRVLAGASASSMMTVTEVPRTGFETSIPIPAGTVGPYMSVQALNAAGEVLGSSTTASEAGLG